jgi:hypothetical protein
MELPDNSASTAVDIFDTGAALPAAKRPKASAEGEALKRSERLESNRTAARESRQRKKVLVKELQRSVIFFTRANAQIRRKNEGLAAMLAAARGRVREGSSDGGGTRHEGGNAVPPAAAGEEPLSAPTLPPPAPAPAPLPDPAAAAAQAQAMTQSNNQFMANWLAMAQTVPNPMAMQTPMGMGMFNPTFHPAAMTHPGLMGMGTAGLGHPFLGQLQASVATGMMNTAATAAGGGEKANASSGFSFEA